MTTGPSVRWAVLDALPPAQAREVLTTARQREYARGDHLFLEGDPAGACHLIARGLVSVTVTTPEGEAAMLRVLGPGQHVGELALLSDAPRNATVTALEKTFTFEVPRELVQRLRKQEPAVDSAFLDIAVNEVRRLSAQVLEITYVPVVARLARRLQELAANYPAGRPVTLPLTKEDLAGLCGTRRPSVSTALNQFKAEGLVELGRGKVVVLDPNGLDRYTS